jgi:hypothetical protein
MDPLVKILHELSVGVSLPRSRELGRALSALGCGVSVSVSSQAADGTTAHEASGYTIWLSRPARLGTGRTLHPGQDLAILQSPNGFWYLRS